PGGINNRRPDRAAISYANLVRQYAVEKRPIVLGGIEASMRRIAHYDFWSDSIRRSLLFDAKADVLVYGMGEYPVVELARRMSRGSDYRDMRGICYIAKDHPEGAVDLASFEEVSADPQAFTEMFHLFYRNNDP
ncbi:MAG TPA: YgiQ family radical SAM protein, partial [Deltaproteobacteria bacterium]|nr:YgiQ family radical SAM protein [Deltaproteobacteria bacterium]